MPARTSEHSTFYGMGALVACIATSSTLGSDKDRQPQADAGSEIVYYDAPDDQGRLSGGRILLSLARVDRTPAMPPAGFTTILDNGPPSNRIDIVYVGDGYLASQLNTYAAHVDVALTAHLSEEPFATYATLFNVYRVDVVSNESGVDHDPVFPTWRDTALDMGFWCEGIERLLCVSVTKAYQFANAAPDVDHVLAVANSTKYGGAGYTISDLATFSGGNFWGPELALHEIGHSLGNLADEYDYNDGANYTGPERPERNVSILDADDMSQQGTKWALWLGDPGIGFGGLVDTYEGAYYHQFGINRPTTNSKMRTLGNPLNLPSVEGMVIEIYRIVDPIDDATPNDQPLNGTELVVVDPVDPVDHALDVQWYLDGEAIEGATQTTLDLLSLDLSKGQYALQVNVVDNTEFVRDEKARATFMTDARSWTVIVEQLSGDLDGDGSVGASDLLILLVNWGLCADCDDCIADIDGNCTVGASDLLILLANWG